MWIKHALVWSVWPNCVHQWTGIVNTHSSFDIFNLSWVNWDMCNSVVGIKEHLYVKEKKQHCWKNNSFKEDCFIMCIFLLTYLVSIQGSAFLNGISIHVYHCVCTLYLPSSPVIHLSPSSWSFPPSVFCPTHSDVMYMCIMHVFRSGFCIRVRTETGVHP